MTVLLKEEALAASHPQEKEQGGATNAASTASSRGKPGNDITASCDFMVSLPQVPGQCSTPLGVPLDPLWLLGKAGIKGQPLTPYQEHSHLKVLHQCL